MVNGSPGGHVGLQGGVLPDRGEVSRACAERTPRHVFWRFPLPVDAGPAGAGAGATFLAAVKRSYYHIVVVLRLGSPQNVSRIY